MFLKLLITTSACLTFLYFFWRKLKEDYTQNQIFTTGFYCLFGIFVFTVFASYFLLNYMFWLSLLGSFIGLLAGINRFKFRIFESAEAWVSGSLGIVFWFYVYESLNKFQLFTAYAALFAAFLTFLFLFFDKYYKKFRWYKSGRVGFSGMAILGIFFLVRGVVAFVFPNMVFFVGKVDIILSGTISFFAFLTVYNLARIEPKY